MQICNLHYLSHIKSPWYNTSIFDQDELLHFSPLLEQIFISKEFNLKTFEQD